MTRLRLRILLLAAALLVPVGLLVHRSLESLAFEREARHRAVAERVFDEMERALSGWLSEEEDRPVGHYRFYYSPSEKVAGAAPVTRSPLASPPRHDFIVGYFQIDPDGTFHSPRRPRDAEAARKAGDWEPTPEESSAIAQLEGLVRPLSLDPRSGAAITDTVQLSPRRPPEKSRPESAVLLEKDRAFEETLDRADRARPLDPYQALQSFNRAARRRETQRRSKTELARSAPDPQADSLRPGATAGEAAAAPKPPPPEPDGSAKRKVLRVEVAPMSGRVIDPDHLLLHRTVLEGSRGFRQGMVVHTSKLADWIRLEALGSTELGRHAALHVADPFSALPPPDPQLDYLYRHRLAVPFSDLHSRLELPSLPGFGGAGYVYGLVGLLVAVTVLGLVALYRMIAVVLHFAERRSNFAAAVSHELKTPLTAIRMYSEMLRDDMVESEAQRHEYYEAMTAESERLTRLINNVLEFSRLERGAEQLSLVAGPITPVVLEAERLLGTHARQQGFDLEVEIDDGLPSVRFDRDAVLQILFNLVDNALKYAEGTEERRVRLCCVRDGDGIGLSVRDYGPGVGSGELRGIFEPFYRGEDELTRRTRGTGIGLALVRSLVEQMGASVAAENAEPTGLSVRILFQPAHP